MATVHLIGDQRYQMQSEQTQEVVLISVQDIEISYNRKKKEKRCKNAEAQIKTLETEAK